MYRSIPRYWMVSVICLLMVTTLCVEYIQVVHRRAYSPAVRRGSLVYPVLKNLSPLADAYHSQHHNVASSLLTQLHSQRSYSYKNQLTTTEEFHISEENKPSLVLSGDTNNSGSEYHVKLQELGTLNLSYSKGSSNQRWYPNRKVVHNSSVLSKLKEKEKRWHKMQRFHARYKGAGLSAGLLQLAGLQLPHSLNLHERGFPDWHNTSLVEIPMLTLQKVVNQSKGTSMESVVSFSLNPDIVLRGEFQKKQMEKYCLGNGNSIGNLPSTPQSLTTLFTHLLYDDSKRIVFCYVPKNGCSNMKRLLLILNGLLPPESSKQNRPSEMRLKKVNSFRNLTAQQAIYKLKNYYKLAIVRNPLERLLSAYRNKLEYPVVYGERKHFPSNLQLFIMSLFRPRQIQVWLESLAEKRHSIFPSFKEFVTYMKMFPLGDYNEHFAPFYELCQPCSVNYDFYANFKIMDYDITSVLEYLSIPLSYYPVFVGSKNTTELMNEYYRLISWREKTALFNAFRNDLNLYYSLYPEETDAHKQLLNESEDL